MFYFDPLYILLSVVGMALAFIPQTMVKNTFSKFTKINANTGMTGAEIAKSILEKNNIHDIKVVSTPGTLSDHYDPSQKVVRLSEDVYYGKSIASYGVAAHEIGHVIQDKHGYLPMKLRAGIFPAVQTGQMLGPIMIMAGMGLRFAMHATELGTLIALAGVLFYASIAVFHLVTLPVEFDASNRAVRALADGGYLVGEEFTGTRKVLNAAALTYVATALYSILELAYWLYVLLGRDKD